MTQALQAVHYPDKILDEMLRVGRQCIITFPNFGHWRCRWYLASKGRNFDEILRAIDSLQLTDKQKLATPVNWKPGDDAIIVPSLKDDDAKKLFPQGWKTLKPYLRTVKP